MPASHQTRSGNCAAAATPRRRSACCQSPADPWTRLNAALNPSAAPGASDGHVYRWTDRDVTAGATYWYQVEAIGIQGQREILGLTSVTAGQPALNRRLFLPLVVR